MKKVMYVMTSLAHKRTCEMLEPRSDMNQMVLGPVPVISSASKIVPEDYSDFKIKNIKTYRNHKEMQEIVNSFKPNVYVEASLPVAKNIKLPAGCKKVYVSHGMIGNHVRGIIKKAGFNTSAWKGCDLYCGATKVFANWVKHVAKVDDSKILLNALPQLDILYDSNYYNSYRQRVLARTKHPNAKKVILFVAFCCKDRVDFVNHNEDYFRTVLELERIAKQNDWLIMVKPRHYFRPMIKFLQTHAWGKKYIKKYTDIQNSKYLHFITTTGHILRYFFTDVIIINGTSTVEVEACAIKKPLFIVRTCLKDRTDPFDMRKTNAAISISDCTEIERYLCGYFGDGSFHQPELQEKRIKDMGIIFDGKMHNRIQNRLAIL